ncbi:cysteine--tRNA ligase [Buchnera aphidicola]|uniref:cysteine--tRNA ligase n=1 Tax=Buchnera aphidicola TaxID=9 RepID=UPI0034643919
MLKIFNTLTKKKELFDSYHKRKVNIYVCGITVYDYCHIGHGRTFTVFDMIVRYLKHLKYSLKYVRNITDIDDKVIKKSQENKESVFSLTNRMILSMQEDFLNLGLLPPSIEPRATEYINIMISMIKYFLDKKFAYISDNGDIFFSINSYKSYGLLSNQILNHLKTNYNINAYDFKHFNHDFVLWKKSNKFNEPKWSSPWGLGRPGWHIECSSINHKIFGKNLDIHGGGLDLLFPHHENERAQSNCFYDYNQYGKYWIHVGMLLLKNQKMSKRLHNTLLLKNLINQYNSEVIRYFFLSTHYRSPIFYDEKNIKKSYLSLRNLYFTLTKQIYNYQFLAHDVFSKFRNFSIQFYQAMDDDFNTPKAISILFEISKKAIFFLNNHRIDLAQYLIFQLKHLANTIGLLCQNPNVFFMQNKFLNHNQSLDINIMNLIEDRDIARKNKQWILADKLRRKLFRLNIILEDTPAGTIWKKIG